MQQSIQCIKDEYPELMEKVNNAFFEEKRAQLFIELIIFEKKYQRDTWGYNKNGIRERVVSGETEYEKLCSAFFEILFQYKYEEVLVLLELFTDENIECLCAFLIQVQNLRYLKDRKISEKLEKCLLRCSEKNKAIWFD